MIFGPPAKREPTDGEAVRAIRSYKIQAFRKHDFLQHLDLKSWSPNVPPLSRSRTPPQLPPHPPPPRSTRCLRRMQASRREFVPCGKERGTERGTHRPNPKLVSESPEGFPQCRSNSGTEGGRRQQLYVDRPSHAPTHARPGGWWESTARRGHSAGPTCFRSWASNRLMICSTPQQFQPRDD